MDTLWYSIVQWSRGAERANLAVIIYNEAGTMVGFERVSDLGRVSQFSGIDQARLLDLIVETRREFITAGRIWHKALPVRGIVAPTALLPIAMELDLAMVALANEFLHGGEDAN